MATQMSGRISEKGVKALERWRHRYYHDLTLKEAISLQISPQEAREQGIITTYIDDKIWQAYKRLVRLHRRSKLDTDFAVYQGGISSCHYVP